MLSGSRADQATDRWETAMRIYIMRHASTGPSKPFHTRRLLLHAGRAEVDIQRFRALSIRGESERLVTRAM
jgi:phosphohistidine phosphatase SixA